MVNEMKSYFAVCVYIVIGIIDLRNEMDLCNNFVEERCITAVHSVT